MLKVSINELAGVSKTAPKARYEYFIKRIADMQELCILVDDKKDLFWDEDDGRTLLHMWSAVEFAEAYINKRKLALSPMVINFDVLGQKVYPMIKEKNAL